jgi:hypothetical protein
VHARHTEREPDSLPRLPFARGAYLAGHDVARRLPQKLAASSLGGNAIDFWPPARRHMFFNCDEEDQDRAAAVQRRGASAVSRVVRR